MEASLGCTAKIVSKKEKGEVGGGRGGGEDEEKVEKLQK